MSVFLVAVLILDTNYASSSMTPITTCCPPGSFLAIKDWQGSRQLPNGLWTDNITFSSMEEMYAAEKEKRLITAPMWSFFYPDRWRGDSDSGDPGASQRLFQEVQQYGRHNYNLGVFCVPDQNKLLPIDGFRGSSYPDPPYTSLQDKILGVETRTKPLAESQILQSTGNFWSVLSIR